ncbi:hypothetical protein [Methylovirgula sp. 4M-Z18]|uniref:hypothetical protein n=1 Tax=Methylovirgula sp. 4M-Z18 TaxID=2293567 RepID=UPI000E2F8C89|nr:hypothetical protein [Methylovirgula sp. 4M-Z18]RFB81044.1 hypothetical protein DYH55_06180 [Methylovirgula sp. 4M-Z18]
MSIGSCRKAFGEATFAAMLLACCANFTSGAAAQSSVSVKNLAYQVQGAKITIPSATLTGTALTDADLAALVAADNTTPLQDRLAKLDHGTLVIPEVDIEEIDVPPVSGEASETVKITVKDVSLADIEQGRIATVSASGANVNGQTRANKPISGTFGTMTAKGVNAGAYLRFLTEARKDPDEPLTTLIENFSDAGLKIEMGGEGAFSLGSIESGPIKARPFLLPYAELMRTLSRQLKVSNPEPAQLAATFKNIADLIESVEYGRVDLHDLSFDGTDNGKAIAVKLGHFAFGGLVAGRIDEYVYENLELRHGDDGYFKIGSFGIRGLDAKSTLDAFKKFAAAVPDDLKDLDVRSFLPTLDQFVIAGVDVDMVSTDHKGNLDHGDRIKMSLGRLELDGSHYILGAPTQLTAILDHFAMPLPSDSSQPGFQPLIDLGYERLDWSAKLDAAWDEATQILKIKELSANSADVGSYNATLTIENVGRDLFQGGVTDFMVAGLGATIKAADVKVVNDGIFERLLAKTVEDSHQTEAAVRKEWTSAVDMAISSVLSGHKNLPEILQAVESFIAHPKSLHLSATSDVGLGISDFYNAQDPSDILDKLELHLTANE